MEPIDHKKQKPKISNKYEKAERYLIYAMLRSKTDAIHIQARLKMSDFVDQVQSTIRLLIDSHYKEHQTLDVDEFIDGLNQEQRDYALNTLFKDILWEKDEIIESIEFEHYISLVKQANYMRRKVYVRAQLEKEGYQNRILMDELTEKLNAVTKEELGIEIRDIRVKRIDLPQEVSHAVFERMNTERQREAREHRSQGKELAEGIRADADRQRQVILAEAFRESERIRGEGDATAAATYASAYTKNPEFYSFIRSLEAYRNSFSSKSDIMILKPDSEFFNYMKKSQ